MKKIIVFGASGDVGQYFVDYFFSKCDRTEYQLVAVGQKETDFFDTYSIPYFRVNITDRTQFERLPHDDVYAIVHLAGFMPARMQGYYPQKYIDVNITGTLNILEYCRECHADRILFSQSFGDIKDHAENNIVLHPDLPRKFSFTSDHSVYVMTKNFAVDLIENYRQCFGLKSFIFRLPTIYLWSPIDEYFVDGRVHKIGYRLLIEKALRGETIEIWGDKQRKKDMVYVKDFCQMLYLATLSDLSHGYYNVGTGIGTTLEDQIKGIVSVFGQEGKRSKIIERPDLPNAPQYIMDITAAVNDLGYRPQYDYIHMLEDLKKEMLVKRF